MNKKVESILFCTRGLLWLLLPIVVWVLVGLFCNRDNIFALLIILLLSIAICVKLSYDQIIDDIRSLKNNKIQSRFIEKESEVDNNPLPHELLIEEYGSPSKEFFWDTIYFREYPNIDQYCLDVLHRDKALRSAYYDTCSIRIWYDKHLISFDYNTPVLFSDILTYRIGDDTTIIPAHEEVSYTTKHKGTSSPALFGKNYNYRGKSQTTKSTSYTPEYVSHRYTLNVVFKQLGSKTLSLDLGTNDDLLREIEYEFLRLGIQKFK